MITYLLNTTSGKTGMVVKGAILLSLVAACSGGGDFSNAGS
jgi:hypothetical protein